MAARIRKGDVVYIRSGDDKGKTGAVLQVYPDRDMVLVDGINLVWKHQRRSQENRSGGRIRIAKPVHVSKVQPVDPASNKGTRVKYAVVNGEKQRLAVKTNSNLGQGGKA